MSQFYQPAPWAHQLSWSLHTDVSKIGLAAARRESSGAGPKGIYPHGTVRSPPLADTECLNV